MQSSIKIDYDVDHRHAAVGMSVIVFVLAALAAIIFSRGTSIASEGNAIQVNESYILSRALELAEFQENERPTEPEIRYLLPGAVSDRTIEMGDATKKVYIFDPSLGMGGIEATFTAPRYEVKDGNRTYFVSNFKRVVGDILSSGNVVLAKEDIVDPPLVDEPGGNLIKITRVEVAQIETAETLPYQAKEIDDPTLERGKKKTEQEGKTGKKVLTYLVRRENGVEVSRSLIKSEIVSKLQDKIIRVGTKIVILSSISGEASWTKGATAMRRYKKGVLIRVTNKRNGKSVETRVGGWGPMEYTGRILDLEQTVFEQIADLGGGTTDVLVEEIKE